MSVGACVRMGIVAAMLVCLAGCTEDDSPSSGGTADAGGDGDGDAGGGDGGSPDPADAGMDGGRPDGGLASRCVERDWQDASLEEQCPDDLCSLDGPRGEGQDGDSCERHEDCAEGLGCSSAGGCGPAPCLGRCGAFCEGPSGECGSGLSCYPEQQETPAVGICYPSDADNDVGYGGCDPFATDQDFGCYPTGQEGRAMLWRPRAEGEVGDACRLPHDCKPGLTCGPDCVCAQLCDLKAEWCDCTPLPGFPGDVGIAADGECQFEPLEPCGLCGDATADGCGEGEACHCRQGSGDAVCAPVGEGTHGDTCVDDSDCARGYGCWQQSCAGGETCGHCHAYCTGPDTGATETWGADETFGVLAGDCPPAKICTTGHLPSSPEVGFCLPE